mmetsp:Transcript_35375/g.56729  ORF Transcript_35375/g.56729 Transcript_35375/m.56729 type:complete len:279 (-) Transcript_35375:518-1354(-)
MQTSRARKREESGKESNQEKIAIEFEIAQQIQTEFNRIELQQTDSGRIARGIERDRDQTARAIASNCRAQARESGAKTGEYGVENQHGDRNRRQHEKHEGDQSRASNPANSAVPNAFVGIAEIAIILQLSRDASSVSDHRQYHDHQCALSRVLQYELEYGCVAHSLSNGRSTAAFFLRRCVWKYRVYRRRKPCSKYRETTRSRNRRRKHWNFPHSVHRFRNCHKCQVTDSVSNGQRGRRRRRRRSVAAVRYGRIQRKMHWNPRLCVVQTNHQSVGMVL